MHRSSSVPRRTRHDVPYPVETVHNVVFCCGAVAEDVREPRFEADEVREWSISIATW